VAHYVSLRAGITERGGIARENAADQGADLLRYGIGFIRKVRSVHSLYVAGPSRLFKTGYHSG
jgi:hypothetical protein